MQSHYSEFKQLMREANYPVTAGDAFAIEDLQWVFPFVASAAYQSGQPFDVAKAFAGTAFPSELPLNLASQLSPGMFMNGTLWNSATLDGKGEWMLVGQGNPVNKWAISNGTAVQVGISPRYRQNMTPVNSGADGMYTLPRADAADNAWAFGFSVATKGEDVTLADYTISLSVSLDSTGAETPVLTFEYDAAANTWTSDEGDTLSDSFQDEDGTVVQDIQSYSFDFIKDKLLPESMRTEDIPFGRYTISLTATNETTGDAAAVTVPLNIM